MIYIGFSTRTHKKLAQMICQQFRHVAPIVITKNKCIIYQFIRTNKIVPVYIKPRDLKILSKHGWIFVKYDHKFDSGHTLNIIPALSCVQFVKRVCRIKKLIIQTPDSLLKYITRK